MYQRHTTIYTIMCGFLSQQKSSQIYSSLFSNFFLIVHRLKRRQMVSLTLVLFYLLILHHFNVSLLHQTMNK